MKLLSLWNHSGKANSSMKAKRRRAFIEGYLSTCDTSGRFSYRRVASPPRIRSNEELLTETFSMMGYSANQALTSVRKNTAK